MDRKTNFEGSEDVEGHFAAQFELWHEPRPHPPDNLFERLENARLKRSIADWYAELVQIVFPETR